VGAGGVRPLGDLCRIVQVCALGWDGESTERSQIFVEKKGFGLWRVCFWVAGTWGSAGLRQVRINAFFTKKANFAYLVCFHGIQAVLSVFHGLPGFSEAEPFRVILR
jgi:hypothetical protein